jgi:arginine/lysine/ornithine decarboxylase
VNDGMNKPMTQERAPFFDALLAYRDAGIIPYSTPGHKRGRGASAELVEAFGAQALALDIPHGGGADDTHRTRGVLRQAEHLAAQAWRADDALFLVNGSSTGNIAFLLAICKPGDTVLVARNLHTSLLSGLILSGARPVYLHPQIHPELNLTLDVPVQTIQHALDQNPGARAVVLVSPAYTGVSSDLPSIAELCRQRGTLLFVDEAWGPHFPFHPELPPGAVQSGAGGGVTSIHKLLAGLTQASLLTFSEPSLTRDILAPAVSMIETTSPSAMIAASIDVARRQMALHGRELLDRTIELAHDARRRIGEIDGIRVVTAGVIRDRPGAGFDPTRIMVDVQRLGITGFQAEELLRTEARIGVEMSDLTGFIVHITIGDTRESVDHLIRGLEWLSQQRRHSATRQQPGYVRSSGAVILSAKSVMTPREAALGRTRSIPLDQAAGAVSAEIVTPYPPGIPVVAPGDVFNRECIEYLRAGRAAGMYMSGPSDPDLRTVRVVDAQGVSER